MRRATLCSFGLLVILVLIISPPGSDAGRRRILMAKKLAALLLLNKKRYIFVAPFPLPVPLPVITKVKHIIHKEKVPVPVPVPHHITKYVAVPVPVPEKSWSDDSWKAPDHHAASSSEVSYKISEKPRHPKHLEKIYSESTHNLKYLEKPTYSEEPVKISDKSYLDGSYKLPIEKSYLNLDSDSEKLPERLYSEESDLKNYEGAASTLTEEAIELPKKLRSHRSEESFKFPDNFSSDELLSKLQSELAGIHNIGSSSEYLNSEASELSAENYPMLQGSDMMIKKKK